LTGTETSPAIIAHRGACGYLPEHSLGAKALAYGMGADYLEQDLVASRDGQLLVLHDLILDDVSDVAARFPQRHRDDGHFYCVDFDLDEIRTLKFGERRQRGTDLARYPGRFPADLRLFRVVTFAEELDFVQILNRSTGRRVGVYPEIKEAEWHREQGIDLSKLVLLELEKHGYLGGEQPIFVQCFDPEELRRIRSDAGDRLRLIQLLSSQTRVDGDRLADIAAYADGIGPSTRLIYQGKRPDGSFRLTDLVEMGHQHGLVVHPYTFRVDEFPDEFDGFEDWLNLFVSQLAVDGLFTDFTDRVARYVLRLRLREIAAK
jgi:glycerophosphoryl diester phosphodiesterase